MARTCFCALLGASFLGAASLAWITWIDWNPRDQTPGRSLFSEVDWKRERDRDEQLEAWRKELFGRDERRMQLAQGVIDQRITLRQAATSLRELESTGMAPQNYAYMIGLYNPGKTMEESLCRKVIVLVKGVLEGDPKRRDAVLARLEAELQQESDPSPLLQQPSIRTPVRTQE
jgi:hypothetical protein